MKKDALAPYAFNFRRLPRSHVLLTNDFGNCAVLKEKELRRFVAGELKEGGPAGELVSKGFVRNRLDLEGFSAAQGERVFRGWKGPHVHIVSLTADCNLRCKYCGVGDAAGKRRMMTKAAAAKVLDFIFTIPAPRLMLEFQGGEPLLNFKVLEFMVLGARRRAHLLGIAVNFSVVTNLGLMDRARMEFLVKNRVTVCSSLDGPARLHDANRVGGAGSSHAPAAKWLKELVGRSRLEPVVEMPNAICTVTRAALGSARAIVDEYVRLGLMRVQLGPLEPLGRAQAGWEGLGYAPARFVKFYGEALRYILELNKAGVPVYEKGALSFIKQLVSRKRPRYQNVDILYRMAYDWEGGIYGSDEARMLADSGNPFFRLGSAGKDSLAGLLESPTARFLMFSSLHPFNQPACSRCAYSIFCGNAPVYNYLAQNNPWGNMMTNGHCALYMGIWDTLFKLTLDKKNMAIFRKWDELYD